MNSYFRIRRMNGEKDNNNTYGGSYTGVMLAPCSFAAYEDEDFGNEIIEPRYEVIANILISFSISASGRADCSATVLLPSGYRADLTGRIAAEGRKQMGYHS